MEKNRPMYSAEISDIIGAPPRWTTRAGSTVLLVIVITIIIVARFVKIPNEKRLPIIISSSIRPFNVTRKSLDINESYMNVKRFKRGQCVVSKHKSGIDCIRAPFDAIFFPKANSGFSLSADDTVGVIYPIKNIYRFNCKLSLDEALRLHRQSIVSIEVKMGGNESSLIALHGSLDYLKPLPLNGKIDCTGSLDSASNVLLDAHVISIPYIYGTLLSSNPPQSIMQRIID